MDGVLADTSFLISLAKPQERNHAASLAYFRACLDKAVPIYLSTIVVAEFSIKQSVLDLELRNFIVLPFNIDHGMKAGQLWSLIGREAGEAKSHVKDDVKLMAQCACESGISHLLTGDERFAKRLSHLRMLGQVATEAIVLSDGFDDAWFRNGQRGLLPDA